MTVVKHEKRLMDRKNESARVWAIVVGVGCFGLLSPYTHHASAEELELHSRWDYTATNNTAVGDRGDGITLTWGIVADETAMQGLLSGESNDPSSLIARLDTIYGVTSGSDLTTSVWFGMFADSYNRWGQLSALTFVYEPNDDGQSFGVFPPLNTGSPGVRPDMRIGGHRIDSNFGVLAYNEFPRFVINGGDMVIDTNDNFYENLTNDSLALRNTVMHEVGHGLGIKHFGSSDSKQLMEPSYNPNFYGPQHNDILAVQRLYGDALEAGVGNDTAATATAMGTFTGAPTTLSIGTDADDSSPEVLATESDFISIDGLSDIDVFGFTLSGADNFVVNILMDPKGPTYEEGASLAEEATLVTKAMSDLQLELLDSGGAVLLSASTSGAGLSELINTVLAPGDYYARISSASGADDEIQMYRLDISAEFVPEPGSLSMLLGLGLLLLRRR